MKRKSISKLGILCVLAYWAGSLFTLFFVRTCTHAYCGLAIIIPFIPWIILFEPYVSSDFAFIALGIYGVVNTVLSYSIGWGLSLLFGRMFRPANQSKKET